MGRQKNNKVMVKKELERALDASEFMWKEGKEQAYIVGYLQGAIKSALRQLEDEKAN